MWSRNKANLYIRDALDDFHYDPKALPSPIAQRKIYRNKLMLTHLIGFGGGGTLSSPGTSYLFAGSNMTTLDHADWSFGSGDFTMDMWVRYNSQSNYEGLISQWEDGNQHMHIRTSGAANHIEFKAFKDGWVGGYYQAFSFTPSLSTWYHIAWVRSGNDWDHYIDGTSLGTESEAEGMPDVVGQLEIGNHIDGSYPLDGNMDEIRVSKGIARWASNFVPPTVAYTSDANTQLLIHCDEAIASGTTGSGATFTDSGNTGHTITEIGNAIRDTTQAKW